MTSSVQAEGTGATRSHAGRSLFDLRPPSNRAAELGRFPGLVGGSLRIVWSAAPRQLCAVLALQIGTAAALAGQLLIGRELLQAVVAVGDGAQVSTLYPWLAALAASTAFTGALAAVASHEQRLLAELTQRQVFDRIVEVAAAVEFEQFEDAEFYDQLQRARNSGLYRLADVVNSVAALATGLITTIGIAVVLYLLNPLLLGLVALAAVFPLVAAIRNSRASYAFEWSMTPESRERQYLLELLTERDPAKEIRIFGAASFLRRRYDALTDERLDRYRRFLRQRLGVAFTGIAGGAVGTAIAVAALIALLARGDLPIAAALTAALAMQQLGFRLGSLTASVARLIESGMFIDDFRVFLRLAERAEQGPAEDRQQPKTTATRRRFECLDVDAVSFRYPNTSVSVLDDVSLRVGPGELVALVGENGSGKTTLVKLICQLHRPDAGRVLWNGVDARALSAEEMRAETTVLFQDFVQYHLTARDNIVLGRAESEHHHDAVRAAAQRSGADRFLDALPLGYDTRLGRQFYAGHELSVGQWQRLALARAFFRDGSFLIMDEPTASLDPRAEADLFAQMRELARGRSVLLVTHRLSSVRTADRIYLLDGGRVHEEGDHASLLALGGRYAELFALQSEAFLTAKG
jgi:ATP-binding cassette, subfamily B, bacterial